ncbi:TIGR01841 family phasin [Paraburkholderia rhizosphaerae]|uniref:Phasin family protein n=1 Tax=Paraburkholderia rhizosphaerae TaxID=480658 RepID=A0A4V3HE52_9BURK|nr:TIGR01841 family phasin [Paraburkholderia rhizosphaerae]TDY43883.1 phasin family protein [Paraburkholderia rhizosphaerae]
MSDPVILASGEAREATASSTASAVNDLTGWSGVYVSAVERLAELNSRAIHTSLEEQRAIALQAAEERSLLGAWRLQASYSLAGTAKAAAYLRHVGDILLGAYADAVNEVETSFNRSFMSMTGAVDRAASAAGSSILKLDEQLATIPGETARIVDQQGKAVAPQRR